MDRCDSTEDLKKKPNTATSPFLQRKCNKDNGDIRGLLFCAQKITFAIQEKVV